MATVARQQEQSSYKAVASALKSRLSMHRWELIWHGVFYVVLVVNVIISYTQIPESIGSILVLSVLLAFWYALCIGIREQIWRKHWLLTILYFGIEWFIWLKLTEINNLFYLVLWGLYPQISVSLDVQGSIVASLSLCFAVVLYNMVYSHSLDFGNIVYNFLGAGISIIFRLFIEAILRESNERRQLIEKLETTRHELAIAERQAGILGERQRLGREIHDTLAQGFTSIVLHLEAAESLLPPEYTTVHHHLDQARQTARDSLAEARRLVWALRPESLAHASLSEALVRVTERWTEESGLSARATVTGTPRALRPEIEVTLLRVAQEGLANIRKHAQASQVMLTLSYMEDMVSLDVLDNGVGFDAEGIAARCAGKTDSGFGLRGMRERITELGGTLLIESAPGEGTTLAISVPALDVPEPVLIEPAKEALQ